MVVIVVIGILSTIAIPMFSGQIDKAHQGRSYAYQAQIDTLLGADCVLQGYSCKNNIVPNWAFSNGNSGEWNLTGDLYEIKQYKLFHSSRDSNSPDYISVPLLTPITANKIYRIDVVARNIKQNGATVYGAGFIGFSLVGSGIGGHARINSEQNSHICDVFRPDTDDAPIRLFVSARAEVTFDEISLREVLGYSDIDNNNDCDIDRDIIF